MTLYRLLVESWSREQIAFRRELLGFQAARPSTASLEERTPHAVADHRAWLGAGGAAVPDRPARAAIVERVERNPHGAVPHVAEDLPSVTRAEHPLARRVAKRSQRELIGLYRRLGPERVVHTLAFGDLPLRDLPATVAELDNWHLACLAGVPVVPLPADPVRAIGAADRHFRWHVTRLRDAAPGLVTVADGAARPFAKTIRRRTGHFREHVPKLATQL